MQLKKFYRNIVPPAIVACTILFFYALKPSFLSAYNVLTIIQSSSILLILTIGVTLVVLMGSLDVSYAAVLGLSGLISASFLPVMGLYASLIGIGIGAFVGLINGIIFVRAKVPSFIVTLGTMIILGGASLAISGGYTLSVSNDGFSSIALGTMFGLPNMFIWSMIILAISLVICFRTTWGRYIYAIGSNVTTATITGVPINRVRVVIFTVSGLLAGVAGVIYVAYAGTANAGIGDSFLLPTFAATFAGGTAITGGVGGPHRALVGTLLLDILANGLNVLSVNPNLQNVIFGIAIIIAIVLTIDREKIKLIS